MRVYPGTTIDYEFGTLGGLGYTGSLNDRQFQYFTDLGLELALPDMFGQFSGGTVENFLLDESGPTDFILHDSADELDPETNIRLV